MYVGCKTFNELSFLLKTLAVVLLRYESKIKILQNVRLLVHHCVFICKNLKELTVVDEHIAEIMNLQILIYNVCISGVTTEALNANGSSSNILQFM